MNIDREGLADFLRRRREALHPSDVGVSAGARRRAQGLRREEVAWLASMSTDFYARLEQRRGARPSEDMLASIARALRLTLDERDHLFALAGHAPPPRTTRSDQPSPGLQRVLDQLATPAHIASDLGVTLSQNALAVALVGVQTNYTGLRRSIIYRWFTDAADRQHFLVDDHPWISRSHVAALRTVYRRGGLDPEAEELVTHLLHDSEEFAQLWVQHEVANRSGLIKRFVHPQVGLLTLTCDTLLADNETQHLVVFTAPPGSADAVRLEQLAARCTPEMAPIRAGVIAH
jgi:transcriptional regulator with XRE-family HTH domain